MEAREFALWAHGDQRYGKYPYSFHLDAVAELVRPLPDPDGFLETVAYLHDVVEDTPVTSHFVSELFGAPVAVAVGYLTDPKGRNRKERKAALHERLELLRPSITEHRAALIVKATDRCANLKQCVVDNNTKLLRMYKAEHKVFRKAVFRPNLCPSIWSQIDEMVG